MSIGSPRLGDPSRALCGKQPPVPAKPCGGVLRGRLSNGPRGSEDGASGKKVEVADLGSETQLFAVADKLRGNMESSDYKHLELGLIFLKRISGGFEEKRAQLRAEYPEGAEHEDEYRADNVFWVPPLTRWWHWKANANLLGIGIDDAMLEIGRVNPALNAVLPKDYAPPRCKLRDAWRAD